MITLMSRQDVVSIEKQCAGPALGLGPVFGLAVAGFGDIDVGSPLAPASAASAATCAFAVVTARPPGLVPANIVCLYPADVSALLCKSHSQVAWQC